MGFFRRLSHRNRNFRASTLYAKYGKVKPPPPCEPCILAKIRYTEGTEKIMKKYACTECSYLYRPAFGEEELEIAPGTPFESVADSFTCPSCGASEEFFHAVAEHVNEPFDYGDLSEEEGQHVATFRVVADGVAVRIGNEDSPHPNEDSHFFEWVALVDEDGEDVAVKLRPSPAEDLLFEDVDPDDFSEIRVCCSVH